MSITLCTEKLFKLDISITHPPTAHNKVLLKQTHHHAFLIHVHHSKMVENKSALPCVHQHLHQNLFSLFKNFDL